MNMAEILLMNR